MLTEEKQKFVIKNYKLIYKFIHSRYKTKKPHPFDDIVQELSLALCRAAVTYIPEMGKFSNYAWRCFETGLAEYYRRVNKITATMNHCDRSIDVYKLHVLCRESRYNWPISAEFELKEFIERCKSLKNAKNAERLRYVLQSKMDGKSNLDLSITFSCTRERIRTLLLRAQEALNLQLWDKKNDKFINRTVYEPLRHMNVNGVSFNHEMD